MGVVIKIKQAIYRTKYNLFRTVSTDAPRVRFAPSPTGYLHLGGLRTALYNYLFAKSRGGTFILRIEDTDQARKVEGAVEALKRDLEWVGIEIGEGPGVKGDYEPYIQSERLDIYQEHITKLLYNGSAYKCFCSERRLNMLRRDAVRAHRMPRYDNRCRDLSSRDVMDKIKAGTPYCIRFKESPRDYGTHNTNKTLKYSKSMDNMLSSEVQSFEDVIFGGVAYDVSRAEGDPVLLKSDGFPTYHLASVVDDHLMRVTHVLRGVEWQISTTKHLLLYRAFNWSPPQFGHLPLIVNADGSKLSKRQSDVRLADYREQGIFPLALVNYMSLAGGGFTHRAGDGVTLKTMDELAHELDISKISCHPSRLNPMLLHECNRLELLRRASDQHLSAELASELVELVRARYPAHQTDLSVSHISAVLRWAATRVSTLGELLTDEYAFLWVLPTDQNLDKDILKQVIEHLEPLDSFTEAEIKKCLKQFSERKGLKFPAVMKVLRAALSGLSQGPAVGNMMALLGKDATLHRIRVSAT